MRPVQDQAADLFSRSDVSPVICTTGKVSVLQVWNGISPTGAVAVSPEN